MKLITPKDLDGFEIFTPIRNGKNMAIEIRLTKTGLKLSFGALSELKFPQYVNIFLNQKNGKIMIKRADQRMANVLKVKGTDKEKTSNGLGEINNRSLLEEIRKMTIIKEQGESVVYYTGYVPDGIKDTLIFETDKIRTRG